MDANVGYFMQAPQPIVRSLGRRVRARRLAAGLTQSQLAKRAAVSRDTVTRMERGANIGLEPLVRLAIALGAASEFATLFPEPETRSLDEILAAQRKPQRVRARAASSTRS